MYIQTHIFTNASHDPNMTLTNPESEAHVSTLIVTLEKCYDKVLIYKYNNNVSMHK